MSENLKLIGVSLWLLASQFLNIIGLAHLVTEIWTLANGDKSPVSLLYLFPLILLLTIVITVLVIKRKKMGQLLATIMLWISCAILVGIVAVRFAQALLEPSSTGLPTLVGWLALGSIFLVNVICIRTLAHTGTPTAS